MKSSPKHDFKIRMLDSQITLKQCQFKIGIKII